MLVPEIVGGQAKGNDTYYKEKQYYNTFYYFFALAGAQTVHELVNALDQYVGKER